MRAKLKYSICEYGDRFRHLELDTGAYAPQFSVPKGYKYEDFGYELVSDIRDTAQTKFANEATDLVDEMFSELKVKLDALRKQYADDMVEEVVRLTTVKEVA